MKKKLIISIAIAIVFVAGLLAIAPQRFATRYEAKAHEQLNAYFEAKSKRTPQIEEIIKKGVETSPEDDQKLHDLIGEEIKAADELSKDTYHLPAASLLKWHPAYKTPLRIQQEKHTLALEAKQVYHTSDVINGYIEKRIAINKRITNNPLETTEHRQQIIDDYKSLVASNESDVVKAEAILQGVLAARRVADQRALELWSSYPAMYDQGDNAAIASLNAQIEANDQEQDKAKALLDQAISENNQKTQAIHEELEKLNASF